MDMELIADGLNEKGLTGGMLYFANPVVEHSTNTRKTYSTHNYAYYKPFDKPIHMISFLVV